MRSYAAGAAPAAAAGVAPHAAPLNANHQPAALAFVHRHHAKSRQPENPRTIASRSHPSSLVVSASRENTIQFRMANWDRVSVRIFSVRMVGKIIAAMKTAFVLLVVPLIAVQAAAQTPRSRQAPTASTETYES